VVFAFTGTTEPPRLRLRIERGEAAGVILFGNNVRSVAQVRRLTRALQAVPRPVGLRAPLAIMTDQEGGQVQRIPGAPHRSPPQLAVTGRPSAARSEGRAAARTLRGAGVNIDLAPVADVARPGSEMEREGRSFGRSAGLVTRFATAFARGLRAGGVAATFKHFPGFGAAPANTDAQSVVIPSSLQTIRRSDERPYVGSPTRLVMVSSAIYPALDAGTPALLSRRIVTGELRDRLGFTGVTVTDSLDSGSLSAISNVAVRAATAGDDLLLFTSYLSSARAVEAVTRAVQADRLDRSAMRAGVARCTALRRSLGR
jgi:beta-N-acetylhexosaminidase